MDAISLEALADAVADMMDEIERVEQAMSKRAGNPALQRWLYREVMERLFANSNALSRAANDDEGMMRDTAAVFVEKMSPDPN